MKYGRKEPAGTRLRFLDVKHQGRGCKAILVLLWTAKHNLFKRAPQLRGSHRNASPLLESISSSILNMPRKPIYELARP
jgi:hypothetical protein